MIRSAKPESDNSLYNALMKIYLVGGAVRDRLLGIPVTDRDWVVVGGAGVDLKKRGFHQVGKEFPVYLHPESKEQYALARRERKIAPGHTGFSFDTGPEVTLAEDLARRDLTVNAMAETEDGELIDPHGGREDLDSRVLRHVSSAFREDPLRVLRVARFAARFKHLGFRVAPETLEMMRQMVARGELAELTRERVWQELELALGSESPAEFLRVLHDCGALQVILPEVDRLFGVPQPAKHHPEIDTGVHTLMCMQAAARLSDDPIVRYAVLLHDVGKGVTDPDKWPSHHGHDELGVPLVKDISRRLGVPNEYARTAELVCKYHTLHHRVRSLRPATVLRLLSGLDAIRRPRRFERFLTACLADARGRTGFEDCEYPQNEYLEHILAAVKKVDAGKLVLEQPDANAGELIARGRIDAIREAQAAY